MFLKLYEIVQLSYAFITHDFTNTHRCKEALLIISSKETLKLPSSNFIFRKSYKENSQPQFQYNFSYTQFCVGQYQIQQALQKKVSFSLRISSVNVTKSAVNYGLVTCAEKIRNRKLHFLCSEANHQNKIQLLKFKKKALRGVFRTHKNLKWSALQQQITAFGR